VRKGNPDLALTDLNKALELEIRHKEAYLNRGAVYNELGKFELRNVSIGRGHRRWEFSVAPGCRRSLSRPDRAG
jgi:tetratricopeptide (TPR) repeat protein